MSRQEQLNQLFQQSLAQVVAQEFLVRDALITIKEVKLEPNLKTAQVKFSVLPVNLVGTALNSLRSHTKKISWQAANKINLRSIPRLIWQFDDGEEKASELDNVFAMIEEERKNDQ